MVEIDDGNKQPQGRWEKLWRKPGKWFYFGVPAGGYLLLVTGVLFLGTFIGVIESTSTETFCISCHEMEDNVYEEYQQTIHYSNRTGVRATCPDCHVPKKWGPKLIRKMQATVHEIPHWLLGTIDTPEKFDQRRLYLAKRVWSSMKNSDSRECRNCHELEHMDLGKQGRTASRKHTLKRQIDRGETCIDCHQGIAHTLPEGWEDEI